MDDMIFFDNAKEGVTEFFEREFYGFPALVLSHFLNKFNTILNFTEEDRSLKPTMVFTDSIDSVIRSIPKSYALTIFEDNDLTMFSSRLKQILSIAKSEWCFFVDIKEEKISYGLIMSFSSIKDRNLIRSLEENTSLRDKTPKVNCIIARPLSFYSMSLHSISGNNLIVNMSLDKTKSNIFKTEIREFVDVVFSKFRTTPRKLNDMKNMYLNIFTNVLNYVHGSICVIVDKDYKDNGLFEDGIWLKEPISFSKLFNQSKSYNEAKLQAFADLFMNMLNFDGITIVDNQGRIRAYNVFVETNSKRIGYVVGGARKRAAYQILSSKKRGILGVYFQSHEGEVFFQEMRPNENTIALVKSRNQPQKIEPRPEQQRIDNLLTNMIEDYKSKDAKIDTQSAETQPKDDKK